jgi:hypothetical protein
MLPYVLGLLFQGRYRVPLVGACAPPHDLGSRLLNCSAWYLLHVCGPPVQVYMGVLSAVLKRLCRCDYSSDQAAVDLLDVRVKPRLMAVGHAYLLRRRCSLSP